MLALEAIELMVILRESVPLARIEHELDGLAAILQCAEIFHWLTDRDALIAAAVQNQ